MTTTIEFYDNKVKKKFWYNDETKKYWEQAQLEINKIKKPGKHYILYPDVITAYLTEINVMEEFKNSERIIKLIDKPQNELSLIIERMDASVKEWMDVNDDNYNNENYKNNYNFIITETQLALKEMHKKGWVHGDLHFGNVCINLELDENLTQKKILEKLIKNQNEKINNIKSEYENKQKRFQAEKVQVEYNKCIEKKQFYEKSLKEYYLRFGKIIKLKLIDFERSWKVSKNSRNEFENQKEEEVRKIQMKLYEIMDETTKRAKIDAKIEEESGLCQIF